MKEPCIYANDNTFTSFARELNPTGVGEYIYIYIYVCVCVCVMQMDVNSIDSYRAIINFFRQKFFKKGTN